MKANSNTETFRKMTTGIMFFPTVGVILLIMVSLVSALINDWQSDNGSEFVFYLSLCLALAYFLLVKFFDVPGR